MDEKMEIKPGRPSLGVTKKVSITLPEEVWSMIDDSFDNRSGFFRSLVEKEIFRANQAIEKIREEISL